VTAAPRRVRAPSGADPIGRRARLALSRGHLDVGAEADDAIELQVFGQHPVEFLVAKATIRHDAHAHPGGQHLGQALQHLILVRIPTVLQRGLADRQPDQRRRAAVAGQQRQHDRRLVIGVELGPIQGDHDAVPAAHHIGHPVNQQCINIDPTVGQHSVHLLDRMLGQPSARQCQPLADHADRQRCRLDHPQRRPGQRLHALGVQVIAKQRVQEAVDAFI